MTDKELCRKVAENVMGWPHGGQIHPTAQAKLAGTDGPQEIIPLFLTWADAGRVINKLYSMGMFVRINGHSRWFVEVFSIVNGTQFASAIEDDFPNAAFQAALKAVNVYYTKKED